MERRLPPTNLQKQVETYLQQHLPPRSLSAKDIAGALVRFANDGEDNPVKALFRVAGNAVAPTATHVAATPQPEPVDMPATVRPRSSKLSLRFSRNKGDRPGTAAGPSNEAILATSGESPLRRGLHSVGFGGRSVAAGEKKGSGPPVQPPEPISDTMPECVQRLQTHAFLRRDDQSSHSRKIESESRDEKRGGFFTFATSPKRLKGKATKSEAESCTPTEYSCVFCERSGKFYSSKGTCKRHLEAMHVARKYLRCDNCPHRSQTVPDARKHSAQCSSHNPGWHSAEPDRKLFYSSEFFKGQVFTSQPAYVDHLLELCALHPHERPPLSHHLKLRNLLERLVPTENLADTSRRILGDPHAWSSVRWDYSRIRLAVKALESGILDRELHATDMLRLHRQKAFIEELLGDRLPQASSSSNQDQRFVKMEEQPDENVDYGLAIANEKGDSNHGLPKMEMMSTYNHLGGTYYSAQTILGARECSEANHKRPLSYETASKIPERHPPGPSSAPLQGDNYPGFDELYTNAPSYNHTISPMYSNSLWPLSDQPPPYETNYQTVGAFSAPQSNDPVPQINAQTLGQPAAQMIDSIQPPSISSTLFGRSAPSDRFNMAQDRVLNVYSEVIPHDTRMGDLPAEEMGYENFDQTSQSNMEAQQPTAWASSWYDSTQDGPGGGFEDLGDVNRTR